MLDRIKEIIKHNQTNISAFERSIGTSEGVIRRALKNGTDIQGKWLVKIAERYPEINTTWLLTGKGSMLEPERQPRIIHEDVENYQISSQKTLIAALREQISLLKDANSMLKERNEELKAEVNRLQTTEGK